MRATSIALEDHELIKVKLGQNFPGERVEAAEELAAQTGAAAVQVIGRVVVLYRRRSREDPKRPRIELRGADRCRLSCGRCRPDPRRSRRTRARAETPRAPRRSPTP
ncbi:YhbY family RNA-binding protein [Nannocystis pusilla]|uniref:YhbY family RNA-binding protein n=1 Tax=Nannocystis pusilla TaxID=889268 RepID=UPI003B77A84D